MEKQITIDEINKLCELSELQFTDEEKVVLVKEVGGIIELLDQCGRVRVDDSAKNNCQYLRDLREDKEDKGPLEMEDIFNSTSNASQGYFVVPKVVD